MTTVLNIYKHPIEKKSLSVCKLHCITEESFKSAFNEGAINLTSPVDTVLYQLNDELHKALDTIALLKQIQVAVHQKQPWFDEIVKARHKVEWIWHKSPTPNTWKAFKVQRNVYNRLLNYKKRQLISKQVTNLKGNNKKLYKLMAQLAGIRTDNPLPPIIVMNHMQTTLQTTVYQKLTKYEKISLDFQSSSQKQQIFQPSKSLLPLPQIK